MATLSGVVLATTLAGLFVWNGIMSLTSELDFRILVMWNTQTTEDNTNQSSNAYDNWKLMTPEQEAEDFESRYPAEDDREPDEDWDDQ